MICARTIFPLDWRTGFGRLLGDSIRTLHRSYFWLLYLGITWFVIAIFPAHFIVAPLCLLGFFWAPAWGLATRFNRRVFRGILLFQPWYHAEISISLPRDVELRKTGCLIIANHRSHLDAFILFREITHLRLVAKQMLFFIPLYGHMMFLLRMIPIRRKNAASYVNAMKKIRAGLRAGQRIHVFAEMTRCNTGALATGRFHHAPFQAAREAGVPILPIAFWGTDAIWGKGSQRISLGKKAWAKSLPAVNPLDFPDSLSLACFVQREIDHAVLELRALALRENAP